jgi:hypothetical protein
MRVYVIPAALLVVCLTGPASPAQERTPVGSSKAGPNVFMKRLILKDGSYQIVTKWEVKKDRVRYYSAERAEWEEIPNELVDWAATEKWNEEHGPGSTPEAPVTAPSTATHEEEQKEAAAIDAQAAAERADQEARTPLVAPGLHLPDRDGIFVLDDFQSIPELVHLDQSTGNVNRDTNHNVLRAAIGSFSGAKEPVRLDGQSARVRVHVDDPVLYVSLDTGNSESVAPEDAMVVDIHDAKAPVNKDDYSSPESRYAIVRVDVRPGERVIGAIRVNRAGEAKQSADIVPTKAEILPGKHWMKLTPQQPLPIGEYALMEILQPGVINLDVWDFGVSPNAPENRHPITPVKE